MLPWACRAAVSWKPGPVDCPVYQIHGDLDPVLPHRHTHSAVVIPRAGHLLPLTHPFAISDLLRQGVEQAASWAG
jgi:pimeloyl-ACP methyl ester carboxylesterase